MISCTGKILRPTVYKEAFKGFANTEMSYLLDYTVPFMPLKLGNQVKHVQIGVLESTNRNFLKGPFDVCFGRYPYFDNARSLVF